MGIYSSYFLIYNLIVWRIKDIYSLINLFLRLLPLASEKEGNGCLVLIHKNGDCEVEASFTEHEVAFELATGLTYCYDEWKQQPDPRRK